MDGQRLAALAIAVAAALRGLRVVVRWDEVSWQYAAYVGPMVEKLREGDLTALLDFTGLHPPLYYGLLAAGELALPVPLVWMAFSALCSLGAVAVFWKRPVVAALMATSPIQLAYAAELNNYPLTALVIAALWALKDRPRAFAALCVVAPWTHGLAGFVALTLAVLQRNRWAGGALLVATLPLLPGVQALILEAGTYTQPGLDLELSFRDFVGRFGLIGAAALPLAVWGARMERRVAAGLALSAAFVGALVLLRVAAPHQFPYWLAFIPPLALLVEASGLRRMALGLAVVQGLWWTAYEARRVELIAFDNQRAVDAALERAVAGDGIYLLAPPLRNDDDKGASSPVLWRFPPWQRMPAAQPYAFAHDDFRHGQPRAVGDLTVYVNDSVRDELSQAIAAHDTLWLVVYEHREDPRFTKDLAATWGACERFGSDCLWALK